jgi:hypothetical protein
MILVDIGGHPPILLAQNTFFYLGSFSTIFQVLNFWGCFEALNNIFLTFVSLGISHRLRHGPNQNFFFSIRTFQQAIICPKHIFYENVTPSGSCRINYPHQVPQTF